MILDPFKPAFHGRTNQILIRAADRDMAQLAERWYDEASEFAVANNPQRAGYIEYMTAKLLNR